MSGGVVLNPVSGGNISITGQTTGDILYFDGTSWVRLGIGTARQGLITNAGATAPSWAASLQSLMTATGDIVYASSANTPARLAIGSGTQVLGLSGGVPAWTAAAGTTVYGTAGPAFTWTAQGETALGDGMSFASANTANNTYSWRTTATFTPGTQQFHYVGRGEASNANKIPYCGFNADWTQAWHNSADSAGVGNDGSGGGRYLNTRGAGQTATAETAFNTTNSHYEIRLNGTTNIVYVDDGTTDATHTTNLPTAAMSAGLMAATAGTAPGSTTQFFYQQWWVEA